MTVPGCFGGLLRSKSAKAAPNQVVQNEKPVGSSFRLREVEDSLPAYSTDYAGSDALKTISDAVDKLSASLREISIQMHDNPEIAWKERKTAELLSGFMENMPGWTVKRHVYGTETGWEASFQQGHGGRVIGVRRLKRHHLEDHTEYIHIQFNSEMDALPGIGHACGHNLIASTPDPTMDYRHLKSR